jgi:hypothetical protein
MRAFARRAENVERRMDGRRALFHHHQSEMSRRPQRRVETHAVVADIETDGRIARACRCRRDASGTRLLAGREKKLSGDKRFVAQDSFRFGSNERVRFLCFVVLSEGKTSVHFCQEAL